MKTDRQPDSANWISLAPANNRSSPLKTLISEVGAKKGSVKHWHQRFQPIGMS
jgi:hypothetical protein